MNHQEQHLSNELTLLAREMRILGQRMEAKGRRVGDTGLIMRGYKLVHCASKTEEFSIYATKK